MFAGPRISQPCCLRLQAWVMGGGGRPGVNPSQINCKVYWRRRFPKGGLPGKSSCCVSLSHCHMRIRTNHSCIRVGMLWRTGNCGWIRSIKSSRCSTGPHGVVRSLSFFEPASAIGEGADERRGGRNMEVFTETLGFMRVRFSSVGINLEAEVVGSLLIVGRGEVDLTFRRQTQTVPCTLGAQVPLGIPPKGSMCTRGALLPL